MKSKSIIKTLLYQLLPKKNGYSKLKVLSGPAKGAYLTLDVRIEGSYWIGNYDQWIFDAIPFSEMIKPGDVVWDCGAYVGYYTAVFRKLVGSEGKVHTFEAARGNYSRLKNMPQNNGWSNVFIHNMAIGPEDCTIQFVDNLGGANGPFGLDKSYKQSEAELQLYDVTCAGVDELIEKYKIDKPDYIKFDLESAEIFALHNGDKLFREKRPLLLLELHGINASEAAGRFLEKYNYEGVYIEGFRNKREVFRNAQELVARHSVPHMIMCTPL